MHVPAHALCCMWVIVTISHVSVFLWTELHNQNPNGEKSKEGKNITEVIVRRGLFSSWLRPLNMTELLKIALPLCHYPGYIVNSIPLWFEACKREKEREKERQRVKQLPHVDQLDIRLVIYHARAVCVCESVCTVWKRKEKMNNITPFGLSWTNNKLNFHPSNLTIAATEWPLDFTI